ncbi:hypothetical protein AMTR_s00070p00131620 [Amborella trichopoda]|uniref:Uncharacterized protein n=1 Tax=Amborella trichopoda TaxID=13333 RepID=U5DEJ1_AMBTC|nr:hypothetical protein AMTR_s00070p00131620 [Amborella trichopoda]
MKTPGMDVEDEDIPDMPTHSRASEKDKSPASTASRPRKRKMRAVAHTLQLMVEVVVGLRFAFTQFKNVPNESMMFVRPFSSLKVLKMMSLQRHAWGSTHM